MVNFAGTLPKGGGNGLDDHTTALIKGHAAEQKYWVVGVVQVAGVSSKRKDNWMPTPTLELVRVELVPVGDELEADALRVFERAQDLRSGGAGQQRFDLPDEAPVEAGPLELDAGGGFFFRVADVEPGVFELRLCSQYVEGLLVRRLHRSEWGEVPPGDYQAGQFDEALAGFAERLLVEWESGGGAVDGVVDAEVVEGGAEGGDSE